MRLARNLITAALLFLLPVFVFPQPAYAYLDPSAGSLCMQALFGCWLALGFVMGRLWTNIVEFLKRPLAFLFHKRNNGC